MTAVAEIPIVLNAPIQTWFGIGGGADRLATPESMEQLRQCLATDVHLRVLGDGANLLVDDDGVGELVVALSKPAFMDVHWDKEGGRLKAGAGANLPKLVIESVRLGLGGLEGLGGIPATIGGAIRMNAGGAFGQIADVVDRVHGIRRDGSEFSLGRKEVGFSYRHSGLDDAIITSVELALFPTDAGRLRTRHKEVMAYKAKSQPMADRSAGCVFKNPTLKADLKDIGASGQRVSAGMLIDRAGCKGMAVGGASVSERHGNFIVTDPKTAKARHVIELMEHVVRRVDDYFGVTLEREVVVWQRSGRGKQVG
ncbi:MAG TPA: UDP-N-acetylmuramate dehydrogenase [Phycisphaerales bacterium]|nr:UDP-N-acetylmuramate dehydrogenase [Phycisphaerales bacterium]